jgi:RNA polymerase sigma-70 factor (ECF subfamily)
MTAALAADDRRNDSSDAVLIERSWHEPEAFAALFDRHGGPIHRYVSRRLGASAADDVVGDTFLAAFRQRRRYDLTQPDALPWLYGIASNLVGRHRRTEVRAYRALARSGVDPVVDSYTEQVEARVTAEGLHRRLAAALARLAKRDRDVLLLYAWADLSYADIATALRIPTGTVRSRLNRARAQVRAALGGTDPTVIDKESGHG